MNGYWPKARCPRPRGFIEWRPQRKSLELLDRVGQILNEYQEYLPMTLRQIFYRLVGGNGYEKTENAYGRLCEIMNRARRASLVPFYAIRDDGFSFNPDVGWKGPDHFKRVFLGTAKNYRCDRQHGQPRRIALWCEAQGMHPQLSRVGELYSVPVYSSGGFDSVTVKRKIAEQFAKSGPIRVLHVGDHDPSGVHIFNSLFEDITAFAVRFSGDIEFLRLAVKPDQIERFDLPMAPPKPTDRRAFVGETVQAEALPPDVLSKLVDDAIRASLDLDAYDQALTRETSDRKELIEWISRFPDVGARTMDKGT